MDVFYNVSMCSKIQKLILTQLSPLYLAKGGLYSWKKMRGAHIWP